MSVNDDVVSGSWGCKFLSGASADQLNKIVSLKRHACRSIPAKYVQLRSNSSIAPHVKEIFLLCVLLLKREVQL